jgi:hypothetical protein
MTENNTSDTPFAVGVQTFPKIISSNQVYVDKTGLIHDLITGTLSNAPLFLSRPRRFGKSLLLNTIKNIFQGNRKLFSGLEIERRLGYRWDVFPVISLSLNTTCPKQNLFEASLLETVKEEAKDNGIDLDASSPSTAILKLIRELSRSHKSAWPQEGKDLSMLDMWTVVLLIDEYDYPLIGNIGSLKDSEKIRLSLRDFFSSIKACADQLRFVLITGITKFRQLSLFSSMNNTRDISLDEHFATICGFTKNEIVTSFSNYFDKTISTLKQKGQLGADAAKAELLENMMKWYNGYTWDGKSEVLNPLSVLNFFENKKFSNYLV